MKTDAEKTPTDKKRDRRKKKMMKRLKLKEKERRQKLLESKSEPSAKLSKKASEAQLKKLTKERGTSLLKVRLTKWGRRPPDPKACLSDAFTTRAPSIFITLAGHELVGCFLQLGEKMVQKSQMFRAVPNHSRGKGDPDVGVGGGGLPSFQIL